MYKRQGSNNAEWVAFKNMVKSILNGGGTSNSTSGGTQTKQMYRVRKTWADAASQKGAFTSLENAKKCADENKGYSVFDSNGNKVYPVSANTGTSCNYVVKITVDGLRYRDNPGTSGTKDVYKRQVIFQTNSTTEWFAERCIRIQSLGAECYAPVA